MIHFISIKSRCTFAKHFQQKRAAFDCSLFDFFIFISFLFSQNGFHCFPAEGDGFVQVFPFDIQGRIEVDHVAHGTEDEAEGHGSAEDVPADAAFRSKGFLRGRVFHQLDGIDETDAADFADVLMTAQGFHEFFVEVFPVFLHFFKDMIPFHDAQDGEGNGTAHGVACVGVAVDEGFMGAVVVVEGFVDFVGGDGEGHGHVACGESLGGAEDIRGNAGVFDGKEFPGTAESGGNFVVDEENAVFVAEGAEFPQIFRRVDAHACRTLENGFDDDGGGDFPVFFKGFLGAFKAFGAAGFPGFAVGTAVAVEALEVDVVHQHGVEDFGVHVHGAYGEGADGFAVVGFGEAHEAGSFGMAGLVVVLEGHFQSGFHGGGAVVMEGESGEALRQDFLQFPGQLYGGLVGEVGENDVFEPVDLVFQGLIDFRIGMAEEVAPPRGNDVQIGFSSGVVEVDAFAVIDDDRGKYFIVLHLHGGVPDVFPVFFFPVSFHFMPPHTVRRAASGHSGAGCRPGPRSR